MVISYEMEYPMDKQSLEFLINREAVFDRLTLGLMKIYDEITQGQQIVRLLRI